MAAPNFDRGEILRTWHIFRQSGEVLELRIPEAGRYKTISGYFDDPGKLADAVIGLADESFPGIYFSVNPVKPALLARAANRTVKYAKTTTSDADIIVLHWLPVDLDAKRPAGISSTDEEHEAAISKTWEIRQWLIEEQGWPAGAFILADSGNGGHLNIKIDLPTTDRDLVEGCLATLDFLFSNETVEVDTTSGNPARIWKLYGTIVKKGDNLPERPHRLAQLLEVPDRLEAITKDKLKSLVELLPAQEEEPKSYTGQGFDPVAYCREHGLQVHHTKTWTDPGRTKCTLAVLEQCIFNPDHHLSACIIGWPNGARTYRCRHHSCLAKYWADAKAAIEGEGALPDLALGNYPRLEDLTKATGRIDRVNPMTGEKEPDPITGEAEVPKLTLSPSKAAVALLQHLPLAVAAASMRDKEPPVWIYDGGIWHDQGQREIINMVDHLLQDLSYDRGLRETLRRIRGRLSKKAVTFDADPFLMPLQDGIVDLRTGVFREAHQDDYLTFRYNASWTGAADYMPLLWHLCSSLPDPRDVLTALDIITAEALRVPFEVFWLFFGGGANGKGMFEAFMVAFFTLQRSTQIRLTELKNSRFGEGALLDKDLWIVSEIESVKDVLSSIKKISSGEPIDTDVKYGSRRQGAPHLMPIFDANTAFDFGEETKGLKRRLEKLDFPFTFGYGPEDRPKDPLWKEKLTRPEVLNGIAHIIAARAPALIESRQIYQRKSEEEIQEEYKRQRFSLNYYCEDCLSTTWPYEKEPTEDLRLTTEKAYSEYLEYCQKFNVTPAGKVPFGRYISERYSIQSINTREDKKQIRYYPGLYLIKSASLAFAEIKSGYNSYNSYNSATDKLQKEYSGITISSWLATGATDKSSCGLMRDVLGEIKNMFNYINSCKSPKDIVYEKYLKRSVASVASVAGGQPIAEKLATDGATEDFGSVAEDEKNPPFSEEYLDEVLVCRKIKKCLADGVTDPLKLAEVVGFPVCTLARNAAMYPGIDLQKAGEILVTMGRACWWPPKTSSDNTNLQECVTEERNKNIDESVTVVSGIEEEWKRAEQERQAREEHFRKKAEQHSNIDQNERVTTQSNIDEDIRVTGRLSFKEKRTRNTNSGKCGTEAGQHVCVICGEDLTGKGQLQKNGLYYCARPGCGYPGREEA